MKRARLLLIPLMAVVAFTSSAYTRLKAKRDAYGVPAWYYDQWTGLCASTYVYGLCTLNESGVFCTVYESEVGYPTIMFQHGLPYYCYQPLYYAF
jgi:hypothetical protein